MAEEEEYLALIPLENAGLRATRMEGRLAELERRSNFHTKLFFGFVEGNVVVVGGEILKWSVVVGGETDGDGRHFFDPDLDVRRMVLLGCRAYGEFRPNPSRVGVEAYKVMSQAVITARNNTVHFEDLRALDVMVRSCIVAIQEWPELEAKYPAQVRIISNYQAFKQVLPECFQ